MNQFKDHPVLHPDFPLLCFAMEARDYRHEATARRDYRCRFCGKAINAGRRYLRLGKKTGHVECVRAFAALVKRGVPE